MKTDRINERIRKVWEKTSGHCHFCGDRVWLHRRGYKDRKVRGSWEIDHVIQKAKGGHVGIENCLPACTKCNRLRWHRKGAQIRRLLTLGLIASEEINKGTDAGRALVRMQDAREMLNRRRRNPNFPKKRRRTDPFILEQKCQEDRKVLEDFLQQNLGRSFTVAELKKRTGILKSRIRPLLELSRRVDIDDSRQPAVYRGRPPKRRARL